MELRQANLGEIGGGAAVIDAPSAQEFLAEIHKRATREQLDAIVAELQRKSERFAAWLEPDELVRDDGRAVRELLGGVFATRRRVSAVLGAEPAARCGERMVALVHGSAPLAERFDAFCANVGLAPLVAAELASELLHFGSPATYWLWARWTWSPDTRTGALPLVVSDDFELEADGLGATYAKVGEAVRFLDETAEAASFRSSDVPGPLGTDVFLVGVYSVYMSTVLGLKMSQEFNAVIPALPELARRLLGIHHPSPDKER